MITKIRNGVFETNSSSTHSIVINSGEYQIPKDTNIDILTGEFGWEIEYYSGFYDKASYALTYAINYGSSDTNLELLNQVLTEHISSESIITYNGHSYEELIKYIESSDAYNYDMGYIDHQSQDEVSEIFENSKTLSDFLFSSNSWFETDNDNH